MNIREDIKKNLQKALDELGIEDIIPQIEHSVLQEHGDYSTNIALIVARSLGKNPREVADQIISLLNTKYKIQNAIDKIDSAGPGFINFWLSKDFLISQVNEVIKDGDRFGDRKTMTGKKIMVEFTDPNPFKEFHIGHLYSNVVGESLCRLLESQGAMVKRVNYQGDVGLHVAKSLWAILPVSGIKYQVLSIEDKSLEERVKLLGQAYAKGEKAYEEDESAKEAINALNKKIYQQDPEIKDAYQKGRKWSLDYFEKIYKRLGTKFDFYYFESQAGNVGLEYVRENLKKGIFEDSEGAVIFPGKKFGFHNRVFINSLGLPTYEAKELGLAPTKFADFPYDLSIIVTGNEINEYFKVLLKALSLISPDLAEKTMHIGHGMVRLPTGKMSSRTGEVVTGEWLLDEAKRRIKENFKDMDDIVAEQVAVGAVKYALLRSGIGKDIAFSFEESINLEGDSGPYLQYSFVRTRSVLRKANISNFKFHPTNWRIKLEPEELALLRSIYRFPEVTEQASAGFCPNMVCRYLFDLAQKFNLFYQKCPILDPSASSGQGDVRGFRVALTQAVGQVLKNGLHFLGIKSPQKM